MTTIDRTAYPRFTRAPSVKELREIYTPTPGDVAFVATHARGPSQKFSLMILLKVYQRLDYFPDPAIIPGAVISHIRAVMKLEASLVPDISSKYLEATFDLSFANKKWLRTVMVRRKRKSWFLRQHLETCVFSYVAEELKSGDLCVSGSEQFADYRSQLLSWQECEPKLAAYCQQLDFPMTAEGFVEHLRARLTEVAAEVDRTRPENHELIINEKGEPALKKLRAKAPPTGLAQLEEALQEKIPERHLLDVLARIDHVTGFTRHFGPLSGSEPKTPDARERHLLTIFAYGTHLGPHQMARHLRGQLSADQLAHLNHRHFTAAKLDAALKDIIDRFHRFSLPRYWGDEKRVAADGMQYDLAEENLLAEKHIR